MKDSTKPNSSERNHTLDIMRLVAAFFVVCIHTAEHAFGDNYTCCTLLNAFSRFAVPFFFVITGFYFDKIKVRKYILNIAKIMFIAVLVYLPILYVFAPTALQIGTSKYGFVLCILFNEFPLRATRHLWFLLALIYGVLLMRVIVKHTNSRQQVLLFAILLLANILISNTVYVYLARNVWFLGLPYMLMGYTLSKHTEAPPTPPSVLVIIMIVSFCLIGVEALHVEHLRDHYVFTPIFVWAVVLFCFSYKSKNVRLSKLSQKASLFIYIYHLAVVEVLDNYIDSSWYTVYRPIVVFLITFGIFIVYSNCRKKATEKVIKIYHLIKR